MGNTFSKQEHLCGLTSFEQLMESGIGAFSFPLKVSWLITKETLPFPVQVAFAVPKKRFKRANMRNLLKRRLRESFRLNKTPFYSFLSSNGINIYLLLIYIASEEKEFSIIEKAVKDVFQKIMAEIQKST